MKNFYLLATSSRYEGRKVATGMVVIGVASEEEARQKASGKAKAEGAETWLSPRLSSCIELTPDKHVVAFYYG